MSIPNNSLSSLLMPGRWLDPDHLDNEYLLDYELGGAGLNDPSKGLQVQAWTLHMSGDDVVISAPAYPQTVLFTKTGITELSLAFDQNMNPFVAFVENDIAKYWWYDTAIPGTTFSTLPANSRTPRCCLDDKRSGQSGESDIILSYIGSDDKLYMRMQRDRYSTEYTLKSGIIGRLQKVGMNHVNRLQWLIQDPLPSGV